MKANYNPHHPYVRLLEEIREKDVEVIDNVVGAPVYGESYIAPDLLIVLCHQGTVWNKDMPDNTFEAHDVAVLLPDQIVISQRASADYQATIVAVSRSFCMRLQHTYPYTRYAKCYRRCPASHLSDEQYDSFLNVVNLLRTLSKSQSAYRAEMLANLLSIALNMVGEYYVSNRPDKFNLTTQEMLFSQFYESLVRHHAESHEIAFYARECCLSPKYFSEVIKRSTGFSPLQWISTFITIRAKSLLDSHNNYSIQQISHALGFTEQASFTRFFKRETGMTPTEYRER